MQDLRATLDSGHDLPFPDGLIINGRGSNGYTFTVDQGTRFRSKIDTFVNSFVLTCHLSLILADLVGEESWLTPA